MGAAAPMHIFFQEFSTAKAIAQHRPEQYRII
jgi:hypothetical protein